MTDLGVWDFNNNGLAESHVVTIWDSASNPMAQATVDNSGTLVDGFRYVSLTTPTLLLPGDYTIGDYYSSSV